MDDNVKEFPLTMDEEKAQREKYAGMTKKEIETAAGAINKQKEKSSKLSGDLSHSLELFEDAGGHKSALKIANMVANKEAAEAQDWVRSFNGYLDALGVFDQMDMIDQLNDQQKNVEAANVAQAKMAQPSQGKEPKASIQ